MDISVTLIFLLVLFNNGVSDTVSNIEKCLAKVIKTYFRNETIMMYIPEEVCLEMEYSTGFPLRQSSCFDIGRIRSSDSSFVIASKNLPGKYKYRNTVILATGDLLRDIISDMKISSYWDTRVFVVVFPANQTESLNLVRNIFQQIWTKTRLMNTIVMSVDSEAEFSLYSWYPYEKDNCENPETVKLIDKWMKGRFHHGRWLFFKRLISRGLNGCPVNMTTALSDFYTSFEEKTPEESADGLDLRIIREICRRYEITVRYVLPPPGDHHWFRTYKNGSLQGPMRMLFGYETEVAFSGFRITSRTLPVLTFSEVYFLDPVQWFVPKVNLNKDWKMMLRIFTPALWMFVFLSLIICSIFTYFLYKFREGPMTFSWCFFGIFSLTLGQPIPAVPLFYPLRFFLLCYLVYSLNIATSYQSLLVGFLTAPGFRSPYTSLQAAFEGGLDMYFVPTDEAYYENDRLGEKIFKSKQYKNLQILRNTIREIIYNKTAALLIGNARIKHLMRTKLHDGHGKPLVDFIPGVVSINLIAFHLSPNNAMKEIFDKTILRLSQGGLMNHWENDLWTPRGTGIDEGSNKSLNLGDMKNIFRLYAMAILISCIVFVCEIVTFNVSKKIKQL